MTKLANGVPVKTRLPACAWLVAAMVVIASLAVATTRDVHAAQIGAMPAVDETVPQGEDPPGPDNGAVDPNPAGKPGESLSDQLDRNHGVIAPPPTGDSGIHTEAPNPDPGTTPVIPPPGTPGGDPTIQPK